MNHCSIMAWISVHKLNIIFILLIVFSILMSASIGSKHSGDTISHLVSDFEDNTEPNEGQKLENKLEDYNLNNQKSIKLEMLYVSNGLKLNQFNLPNSLEVFLEVVTPPPEA